MSNPKPAVIHIDVIRRAAEMVQAQQKIYCAQGGTVGFTMPVDRAFTQETDMREVG